MWIEVIAGGGFSVQINNAHVVVAGKKRIGVVHCRVKSLIHLFVEDRAQHTQLKVSMYYIYIIAWYTTLRLLFFDAGQRILQKPNRRIYASINNLFVFPVESLFWLWFFPRCVRRKQYPRRLQLSSSSWTLSVELRSLTIRTLRKAWGRNFCGSRKESRGNFICDPRLFSRSTTFAINQQSGSSSLLLISAAMCSQSASVSSEMLNCLLNRFLQKMKKFLVWPSFGIFLLDVLLLFYFLICSSCWMSC